MLLGLNFINIQIMKFRISRKLKNIIFSIIFAILTFYNLFVNCLKIFRVGRYENLFFFLEGYKHCRVGTNKTGSVGLAEIQVFLGLRFMIHLQYLLLNK